MQCSTALLCACATAKRRSRAGATQSMCSSSDRRCREILSCLKINNKNLALEVVYAAPEACFVCFLIFRLSFLLSFSPFSSSSILLSHPSIPIPALLYFSSSSTPSTFSSPPPLPFLNTQAFLFNPPAEVPPIYPGLSSAGRSAQYNCLSLVACRSLLGSAVGDCLLSRSPKLLP